jgi:hypothetical protein
MDDDLREKERAALEWAADAIKEQDKGDPGSLTGWASHEALTHWMIIRRMAAFR